MQEILTETELENFINDWSKALNTKPKEIRKRVSAKEAGNNKFIVDRKILEEYRKEVNLKHGIEYATVLYDGEMSLQGENLEKWISLVKSQPIFLNCKNKS